MRHATGSKIGSLTCALFAFALVAPISTGASAHAAPAESVQDAHQPPSLDWFVSDEDFDLTGLDTAASLNVQVPPGWTPNGSGQLHLEYSLANTASGSLSIFVNDEYIDDVPVDPGQRTADLNIAVDHISPGRNQIDIVSSIDLTTDTTCRRPGHPGRRIELLASSSFHLPLAPADVAWPHVIAALEPVGNTNHQVDVHLVGPLRPELLTSAARISAAVNDAAIDSVSVAVFEHQADGFSVEDFDPTVPSIVIARDADLGVESAAADTGTLSLSRSSHGQIVLTISGRSGDAINAAAAALTAPDTLNEFVGTSVDVPVEPAAASSIRTSANIDLSLADLGYSDRTLDGPGRDATSYGFDLEIGHMPESVTLEVDATRSGGADLNGVGVIVNGERIGAVAFESDGRTNRDAIAVPAAALRPGRNLVRLEGDFNEPQDTCDARAPRQSIEISNRTTLSFAQTQNGVTLDLGDLPYTFRAQADSAALTVVIPNDPTPDEVRSSILIADLLATSGSAANVVRLDDLDDSAEHHLVIVGEPSRSRFADVIDFEAAPILGVDGLAPQPAQRGRVVLTQRLDAPHRLVLVLAGTGNVGAELAMNAITDIDLRSNLGGASVQLEQSGTEVAMSSSPNQTVRVSVELDSDGVTTANLVAADLDPETTIEPTAPSPDSAQSDDDNSSTVLIAIGAVAFLAAGGAAIMLRNRRRSATTHQPQ